jgi:hypothetical protein
MYLKSNFKGKTKFNCTNRFDDDTTYTSFQTGGLINNRYANQDAQGREKNQFTGRGDIAATEIDMF